MNAVLFLSLVFILGAAVPFPWWPNSAYGRSQHHRLTDKQPPAYETKVFDHEASQKASVELCDDNSDFALKREFEERWIAKSQQEEGDDNGAEDSEKALILEGPDVEPDQRAATVANFMVTFCGEYVKRYPIGGLENRYAPCGRQSLCASRT